MRAAIVFVGAVGVIGCSILTPLGDLEGTGTDAGTPDAVVADSQPDTAPAPPAPCDVTEAPPAGAVYVSTDGNDALGGVASAPFATLAKGIAAAVLLKASTVIVAEGAYAQPSELLLTETAAGLQVRGGWKRTGAEWKRDCDAGVRGRTVLASAANVAVRLRYASPAAAVELATMTVVTKVSGASPADAAGESTYGIFVEANGALTLSDVAIKAGKGGNGGASSPQPAATGTVACNGLACGGSAASAGKDGASASSDGTYAADGFHPANGNPGDTGPNGPNGAAGGSGATSSACLNNCVGQCQTSDSCLNGSTKVSSGATGTCGCGGVGGASGRAGHGGGASIALWVGPGAKLTLGYAEVISGGGGAGSAGGAGGLGAVGSGGTQGAGVSCAAQCGRSGNVGSNCGCVFTASSMLTGGSAGGMGGQGGAGGTGGGGAGGDAFGIVAFGGGLVIADPKTLSFSIGAPGLGAQGAPSGGAGNSTTK